ncbi:MAG TPA: hypothetical protein VKM94_16430 [Blastocatellia bacterium]|nr:hypothetical protein [Blastocatellia bacterium]
MKVVGPRIRVEIRGKDEFWGRAFHVEWEDQFGERELISDGEGHFMVQHDWLSDLNQVAAQTFCRVIEAPTSPARRRWFGSIAGRR